ncbi:uncharacterized protein N7496_002405 [Penicillium cataractarum]|uniref:Uncharacterized protein n=1 Tax=Penicillium cataractarum TaxID=2100454 RepID=A0A9W9VFF7_9EURO|nr:uncharacterized protein N7496_002405 [Penicillium cataractarum]KAJ5379977.1 hypothetical protein N7496_002405 [Penicillium cataractarum]
MKFLALIPVFLTLGYCLQPNTISNQKPSKFYGNNLIVTTYDEDTAGLTYYGYKVPKDECADVEGLSGHTTDLRINPDSLLSCEFFREKACEGDPVAFVNSCTYPEWASTVSAQSLKCESIADKEECTS